MVLLLNQFAQKVTSQVSYRGKPDYANLSSSAHRDSKLAWAKTLQTHCDAQIANFSLSAQDKLGLAQLTQKSPEL